MWLGEIICHRWLPRVAVDAIGLSGCMDQVILQREDWEIPHIIWSHWTERDTTWELESRMREKYPNLFV